MPTFEQKLELVVEALRLMHEREPEKTDIVMLMIVNAGLRLRDEQDAELAMAGRAD